ncbi:hypothetical protein BX600DRAFT_441662 [Xylariales sp. PMI_506]|nr:hypothetical protein BX600DRAFT_441662 [Xylariales sp. PMI_506]
MATQMNELLIYGDPTFTAVYRKVDIPKPGRGEVLIKAIATGLNPKDWKVLICGIHEKHTEDRNESEALNAGDDIAGLIEDAGEDVCETAGGWAPYALAPATTTFRLPPNVSFEAGASIPLVSMTSALSLYQALQLPLPTSAWIGGEKTPVLIYGGSSAVGTYALQLAKLSKLDPIIAVAGNGIEYTKSLNVASHIVDYRKGNVVEEVLAAMDTIALGKKLKHVLDAVSDHGSHKIIAEILTAAGGGYINMLDPSADLDKSWQWPEHVEFSLTFVGSSYGRKHPWITEERASADNQFAYWFYRCLAYLLNEGLIRPHPHEVLPHGLDGILQGIQDLKGGKVSAEELVISLGRVTKDLQIMRMSGFIDADAAVQRTSSASQSPEGALAEWIHIHSRWHPQIARLPATSVRRSAGRSPARVRHAPAKPTLAADYWGIIVNPMTLTECTRRKVKCDKNLPCGRCVRLKLQCSRELVRIKHNLAQHASEIQFLDSIVSDLEKVTSFDSLSVVIQKLRSRSHQLQFGDDVPHPTQPQEPEVSTGAMIIDAGLPTENETKPSAEGADPSLLTTIEHLVWGRMSSKCYPHHSCTCTYRRDRLSPYSIHSSSFDISQPLGEIGGDLPNSEAAMKLVQFHLRHIAWHHGCLHGPTFSRECELFWTTGQCSHPLWIALYLSVLSTTVFAIQNSEKWKRNADVDLHSFPSAHKLFLGFIAMLQQCHYLQDVNVYTVQAITISAEVAHNLGYSQLNATLFNAAVRIAESLGMHRIRKTEIPAPKTKAEWQERAEMEVGKRIWCQMTIQDYFAIYFTDSYSISPELVETSIPLNADDHDLVDMPRNFPTVTSYIRVLYEMAALMPDLLKGFGSTKSHKSTLDQYKHVLDMDRRMRDTVKLLPSCFLRRDVEDEIRIPWLSIARRSLAITSAEKIIMIHRPFLSRSFYSARYDFTRRTCVAAATTILREHEALVEADDLSIWTHTAFCITAAVILCFEIRRMIGTEDSQVDSYTAAVVAARERIAGRESDLLAQRGAALLELLLEQLADRDVSTLRTRVIKMMGRIPATIFPSEDDVVRLWNFSPSSGNGEITQSTPGEDDYMTLNHSTTEFDIWFNDMFNYVEALGP